MSTPGLDPLRLRWLCVYCMHAQLTIVRGSLLGGGYVIPRNAEVAQRVAQLTAQPPPIVTFELLCWHCGRHGLVGAYSEPEALAIWDAAAWASREPTTFARKNPLKRCNDCERCQFDPGRYCDMPEHPRCSICRHCQYRHSNQRRNPARFGGSMGRVRA